MSNTLKVIPTRTGETFTARGRYDGGAMVEVNLKLSNDQVADLVDGLTNGGIVEIEAK